MAKKDYSKAVIYARVSTKDQDNQRQIEELRRTAALLGWDIVSVFDESASGSRDIAERTSLSSLMHYVEDHAVGNVMVWEISRIGRKVKHIIDFMDWGERNRTNIFVQTYTLHSLDSDHNPNPVFKMVTTVFGLGAEMERRLISERTHSGRNKRKANDEKLKDKYGDLATARANGHICLGRRNNSVRSAKDVAETQTRSMERRRTKYAVAIDKLKAGYSCRDVAELTSTPLRTIERIKSEFVK